MAEGTRMQQRRATEAVWNTVDYILADGELGVTTDTGIIKIGNGTSPWSELDPAFDSQYLPILGTAANSELLNGVSIDFLVKSADTNVNPTADSYVQRSSTGTVKGATAVAGDDLVPKAQADLQLPLGRVLTAAATLAATDVAKLMLVNHSSLTAQVVITVPKNTTTAIPVGSVIQITTTGAGGVKINGASGVTVYGCSNVMPLFGTVRLVKTDVDTWIGLDMNNGKVLPKIKVYRSSGNQDYSSYTFVPYNAQSAGESYNPDSEWFSFPASGLGTGRRIICNKDGWYDFQITFSSLNTIAGSTWTRLWKMANDNTETGGTQLAVQTGSVVSSLSFKRKVTAGESFGVQHGAATGDKDVADTIAGGVSPNNFTITRVSD